MALQGCFKGVSRVFKSVPSVIYKDVYNIFKVIMGCFKGVSNIFQECFKDVLRMLQNLLRLLNSVSSIKKMSKGSFKDAFRVFQARLKNFFPN